MKLPRAVSGADVISALEKCGFEVLRQAGSHVRLGKDAIRLTVPLHPAVAPGTLKASCDSRRLALMISFLLFPRVRGGCRFHGTQPYAVLRELTGLR